MYTTYSLLKIKKCLLQLLGVASINYSHLITHTPVSVHIPWKKDYLRTFCFLLKKIKKATYGVQQKKNFTSLTPVLRKSLIIPLGFFPGKSISTKEPLYAHSQNTSCTTQWRVFSTSHPIQLAQVTIYLPLFLPVCNKRKKRLILKKAVYWLPISMIPDF